MLLTRRAYLALMALTLCAACGHARGPAAEEPSAEEPTAEEPESETVAQDMPDPACAEAVVCEGEYEYEGEISSGFRITSAEQLTELRRCRSITGDLVMGGPDWLTEFHLPCLTEVGGNLEITDTIAITTVDGLESVTRIGGELRIWGNAGLTSLQGLRGITQVGGGLDINGNDSLPSLEGLSDLRDVGGDVRIEHNWMLSNLDGLQELNRIGGDLHINMNPGLETLSGLSALREVGGELYLAWDPAPLESLESLRAYLRTNAP